MGRSYSPNWTSKKHVVDACLDPAGWGENFAILKSSVRGNHLWVAFEMVNGHLKGQRGISLFLIEKDGREYGYKELRDTESPFYFDCPLSLIRTANDASVPCSEAAALWRNNVIAEHARKKTHKESVNKLSAGDRVSLYDTEYRLTYPNHDGSWDVARASDNKAFKMGKRQILQATIL